MAYVTAEPSIRVREHSSRRAMPAVARLPLPEALEACLAEIDDQPSRYEQAALVWHARLVLSAPNLQFGEARTVLNALTELATPNRQRAAARLARICAQAGLDDVVLVLERWRRARSVGFPMPEQTPWPESWARLR